jgi:hypothetical protein
MLWILSSLPVADERYVNDFVNGRLHNLLFWNIFHVNSTTAAVANGCIAHITYLCHKCISIYGSFISHHHRISFCRYLLVMLLVEAASFVVLR